MATTDHTSRSQIVTASSIPYHTVLSGPSGQNVPLIVLIHALMSSNHIYDGVVPALHGRGYKTLTFDLPGHGLTAPPQSATPGSVTFDTICSDMHEIISTVAPGEVPFGIVGCSVGGVLSIRYHMLYPPPNGHTTKILSMAAPGLSTLPKSPSLWAERIQKWKEDGNNKDLTTLTLARWFPEPLPPDFDMDRARRIVESCTLEGYELCAWATCQFDYTNQLGSIKDGENVMILAGENDGNIGPKSVLVDVSRRIEGSKYLLMEKTGHIPPMHWPDEYEKILLDFLGGD